MATIWQWLYTHERGPARQVVAVSPIGVLCPLATNNQVEGRLKRCIREGVRVGDGMGWPAVRGATVEFRERVPKKGHQNNLMSEPPPDLNNVCFLGTRYQLYPVEPPCFPNGDCLHDKHSRQTQRTEGVFAVLIAYISLHPHPHPSLYSADYAAAFEDM
ncbi:hypothetical protein ARMSODRAFT_1017961 [Armillaria solidipes]|uniref:Uncharacterized protein n=1 Tax=Armillaria solidipes TaxID=1076256 RepID=A0A2H3BHT3_9AGAR|nr:hypothetical protein ARMSODRAFT_1017961 [Armillaria solidipes]